MNALFPVLSILWAVIPALHTAIVDVLGDLKPTSDGGRKVTKAEVGQLARDVLGKLEGPLVAQIDKHVPAAAAPLVADVVDLADSAIEQLADEPVVEPVVEVVAPVVAPVCACGLTGCVTPERVAELRAEGNTTPEAFAEMRSAGLVHDLVVAPPVVAVGGPEHRLSTR